MEVETVSIVEELLTDLPLPRMVKIRQQFDPARVRDIPVAVQQEFTKPGIGDRIRPGMSVAIGVGSRGIADIATIAGLTVEEISKRGGQPFVVPAMGSHGGATAEGQKQVLTSLGVTEDRLGCPVISAMEVVEVGRLPNGLPVLMDRKAYEADGIVVINRVKPHTDFRGPCESGLAKMLTIGLGKQKGADSCHAYSFRYMAEHVVQMARIEIERANVLFGVAIIENAYDEVAKIIAVPAEEILQTEPQLLVEAKERMPRIMFDQLDVLVVDQIGKEISGSGMDPNITGHFFTPYASGGPSVSNLVALNLTPQTHGNACGLGAAHFTTRRLFDKIDFDYTYANCLTSTLVEPARIPMVMPTDRTAILAAIKTCNARDLSRVRMVRIKDTLHLGGIYISEALLPEARSNPNMEICGEMKEMTFDESGNLVD